MGITGLIVGLAGLWLGTEITVRSAIAIATSLRISEFVVGIVILSVGSTRACGSDLASYAGACENLR